MSPRRHRVTADDAAHYAYAREGNAHALYRYTGPRDHLRGAYLRLLKRASTREDDEAWRCHPIDALVWNLDETTATWATVDARVRDAFFSQITTDGEASTTAPSSWRDDVGVVRLEPAAMRALVDATTRADAFDTAKKRGRDGRTASARETVGQLSEIAAETSEVFRRDDGDGADATCVVELKPKSFVGMTVRGRRVWRFRAHQRLKTRRGERAETSAYWPVDLLGDDDAVERACEALMRCPQNNLRITARGGSAMVDDGGTRADDDDARETLETMLRLLPRIVRDARDVFEFLFDRQRRGGDDDPATFRAIHECVQARMNRRPSASDATADVDALRDFALAQTAKDCGVLFTVRLRITDDDVRALAPPVRVLPYTDTTGRARVCAYRPQIIDASLKSFAKTEAWTRLAEDIAAAVDVDADGDRGREFSRKLFEARPVVDIVRSLASERAQP